MNDAVAGLIGRMDLVGVPIDVYGGTSGIAQVGVDGSGVGINASADGRLTAGVLLVILLGVAGFYVWTRGVQS
jgi:hypothetical protein